MKTERRPLSEKQAKDLQALFEHPGMDVLKNVLQSDLTDFTVNAAEARLAEDVAGNEDHATSDSDFQNAKDLSTCLSILNDRTRSSAKDFSLVTIQP